MPSRSRRARRTVALLVVGALALGCSDDRPETTRRTTTSAPDVTAPAEDRAGPFAVLAGATTDDGELTAGLPIVAGSTLLGPAFPDLGDEGGFAALLVVTGDPVAVYNGYVDAAEALGMRSGGQGGCLPGFGSIVCARRLIDPADGEALSVRVERRPLAGGGTAWLSHAALHYEPPGSVDPEDAGEVAPSPPTSAPPSVELPDEVPATPDDGWSEAVAPGGPDLDLVEGTMLAGPPGPCPCGGRGWSAVLRVEGAGEAAIEAYAAQLGVDRPDLRSSDDGDALVADLGLVPGGITQLRATSDDRGTWLLVAVSLG